MFVSNFIRIKFLKASVLFKILWMSFLRKFCLYVYYTRFLLYSPVKREKDYLAHEPSDYLRLFGFIIPETWKSVKLLNIDI